MDALTRLMQVLEAGQRPSPQRFKDAIQQVDRQIAKLLKPLGIFNATYVAGLIDLRSDITAVRMSFITEDETVQIISRKLTDHLLSDHTENHRDDEPQTGHTCHDCGKPASVSARYSRTDDATNVWVWFCVRHAEARGIRPTGKIT